MHIVMERWESMVYNWCEAVVVYMKDQLTRWKNGKLKHFSYGAIIVYFSLQRVLILLPQQISVDKGGSRDPLLMESFALMACHGDDDLVVRYIVEFFY